MSYWVKSVESKESKQGSNVGSVNHKLSPLATAVKVAIVGLGLAHGTGHSATIEVDSSLDDGTNCTLRDAIISVKNGVLEEGCANTGQALGVDDIVSVAEALSADTVVLQNGALEIVDLITSSFTINGNGVTVDANNESIVLNVDGVPGKLTINDMTLTGGRADGNNKGDAAGLTIKNSSEVIINDSVISGNKGMISSNRGASAGVTVKSSEVVINNSTVSENLTTGRINFSNIGPNEPVAAGMFVSDSAVVSVNNSLIVNNRGESNYTSAGGIRVYAATLNITNSSVSDNYLSGILSGSGGIRVSGFDFYAKVNINNSTISGNTINESRAGSGAAIHLAGSRASVVVENSTLSNNVARFESGIWIDRGYLQVKNSTISGAGILVTGFVSTTVDISNSTIFAKTGGLAGLHFGPSSADVFVRNSIIANSASSDCAIPYGDPDRLFIDSSSIIQDNSRCFSSAPEARQVDPILLPLADNGCEVKHATPNGQACVMTHAPASNSPAIDTAINVDLLTDQIGTPRPQGAASDVGAFEWSVDSPNSPGFTVTAKDAIEGDDTDVLFTITLDGTQAVQTGFDFQTVAGTAIDGEDYIGRVGRVIFPAGETVRERRVTVLDDGIIGEADETFSLVVTDINDPTAMVTTEATIKDFGVVTGEPVIRVAEVRARETRSVASVFVTLSEPSTERVTVNFRTIVPSGLNNPATPGEDFIARSGTINFQPGQTRAVRNITLIDDADIEANEVFRFELSDPVNAEIEKGSERQRVFILNDD